LEALCSCSPCTWPSTGLVFGIITSRSVHIHLYYVDMFRDPSNQFKHVGLGAMLHLPFEDNEDLYAYKKLKF